MQQGPDSTAGLVGKAMAMGPATGALKRELAFGRRQPLGVIGGVMLFVMAILAIGASHAVPSRLSDTRYDCAILGTAHIGLGRNTLLGGKSMSKSHIDGIMTSPTVELDGKMIVADGKVLV